MSSAPAVFQRHFLAGQRIRFHCDNQPIVQAWTNQSSRHPGVMDLIRTLFFIAVRNSFTVSLVHLLGRLNCIADALSRNQNVMLLFPRLYLRSWQSSRKLPETPPANVLWHTQHPPPTGQGSGSTTPSAPSSPLLGSKHPINLYAAYLSQVLQANTIQVYLAAVTHLHLTHGFSSLAHNNPTLNLAIRGMQRSQGSHPPDPRDCLSPLGCWSNC